MSIAEDFTKENEALAEWASDRVDEVVDNRPHPPGGTSKHAAGNAAQLLVRFFPVQWGKGKAERGTAYHDWFKANHPVGYEFEKAGKKYRVMGHEQIVMIWDVKGRLVRQTYIDILLYCLTTNQLEFWDLKTNMGAENKEEIDPEYKAQVNLEAYLVIRKEGLPYYPVCRLLIVDPGNWNATKFQTWRMDPTLGEWSVRQIAEYEAFKDKKFDDITRADWVKLIQTCSNRCKTGRLYYTKPDGSKGYRNNITYRVACSRCDNWQHCMIKLGLHPNRADPGKFDQLLEDKDFFKGASG